MICWAAARRGRRIETAAFYGAPSGIGPAPTLPVTHPLASAAIRAGRSDDAIMGAERQGRAADRRLRVAEQLASTGVAVGAELTGALAQAESAATQQWIGWRGDTLNWLKNAVSTMRDTAARLGFDPDALSLR